MRLPGRVVAGLGELPPEWSPASALLRIAVQAGVPQRDIPFAFIDQGGGALSAARMKHTGPSRAGCGFTPSVRTAVRRAKCWPASPCRRSAPRCCTPAPGPIVTIASLALGVLGVGAGWFGSATIGFVLLALCWLVAECAALLARVERASLLASARMAPTGAAFALLLDAGLSRCARGGPNWRIFRAWRRRCACSPRWSSC
jgi:hypothetical protein